jgi:ADP-heptose:LPS heptosyltransferase
MNIDFMRKIDRHAGTFLCRLVSCFSSNRMQEKPSPPQKILVLLLSEMGSLVLAFPMFQRLKVKHPQAEIFVLLFQQNAEPLSLLRVVPQANIFTLRNDSFLHLVSDFFKIMRTLRKMRIDTTIDCELFARISALIAFLSGAKTRVGFYPYNQEGLSRGKIINRRVSYNPYIHIASQFLALSEAVDAPMQMPFLKNLPDRNEHIPPRAEIGQECLDRFCRRFAADFPHMAGKRLVLFYPGGGALPIRAWPLPCYETVARKLLSRGYAIGIIGLADDTALAEQLRNACQSRNCVNLAGYTRSLTELLGLFYLAELLITNDGGPGHFASLTSIPAIILFGPETPTLYGPLGPNSINVYRPTPCSPCLTAYNHRNSPCDGDNVCLKNIAPDLVLTKALQVLEAGGRGV